MGLGTKSGPRVAIFGQERQIPPRNRQILLETPRAPPRTGKLRKFLIDSNPFARGAVEEEGGPVATPQDGEGRRLAPPKKGSLKSRGDDNGD